MINIGELYTDYTSEGLYRKKINECVNELQSTDCNELTEEITDLMINNADNRQLLVVLDVFLELKSRGCFKADEINTINEGLIEAFDFVEDNDISFRLLGYLIQNNLADKINTDNEDFNKLIKSYNSEKDLAEQLINIIAANSAMSVMAMRSIVQVQESTINIFKTGEIIRKAMYNDDSLAVKFNEVSSKVLNSIDYENDDASKILEFMMSIYQDEKLLKDDKFSNLELIRNTIMHLKDRFLDNMYMEIAEKSNFNTFLNIHADSDFEKAARGKVISEEDSVKLNDYLLKTMNSRKCIKGIDLDKSYHADEILKYTGVNSVPVDLKMVMEKLNIQYYEDEFESSIEGYSFKLSKKGKGAVIINSSLNTTDTRNRFTLAHEIGHICQVSEVDDNSDLLCCLNASKINEREADKFAGELLLPSANMNYYLSKDLNMKTIKSVAEKYNTSLAAASIRLTKMAKGHFIFLEYEEDVLQYKIYSKDASDFKVPEDVETFITSTDESVKQHLIGRYKVDIEVCGNYKYVLINDLYNMMD